MRQHTLEVVMTGHGLGTVKLDGKPLTVVALKFNSAVDRINTAEITLIVERAIVTGPAKVLRGAPGYEEFNARRGKRR